jgi:hypothetical protein
VAELQRSDDGRGPPRVLVLGKLLGRDALHGGPGARVVVEPAPDGRRHVAGNLAAVGDEANVDAVAGAVRRDRAVDGRRHG